MEKEFVQIHLLNVIFLLFSCLFGTFLYNSESQRMKEVGSNFLYMFIVLILM